MIPDKLDEVALRRPEFQPGVAITLSDGQDWQFPRPVLSDFYPAFDADGKLALTPGFSFGPGYDTLVDAYVQGDSVGDEHLALVMLALELLRRNYVIEVFHLRYLLRLKRPDAPDAEANQQMWADIAAVALGRDTGPKPTAGG